MYVRIGWSGETGSGQWSKTDVAVDETDLVRLLTAAGLPADCVLTARQAYVLLDGECDQLLLAKLATSYGMNPTEARERIAAARARQAPVIEQLRQQVQPPAVPEPV